MVHIPLRRDLSKTAKLIATVLCKGLNPTPEARKALIADYGLEPGFVQGSVFLLDGKRPINTAVLDSFVITPETPVLELSDNGFEIRYEGQIRDCTPLKQPDALKGDIGLFGKKRDLAQLHSPTTLFFTPIRECVFAVNEEICKFCNFSGSTMRPASPKDVASLVELVTMEVGSNFDIAIGSGTPNLNDGGARYFLNLASEISKISSSAISVEMIPFEDIELLIKLKKNGVRSIISSIEIWDDRTRKNILPGKSKISKEQYLSFWKQALSTLGRGQVSSVLIAGLDSVESTKLGISTLIENGIIPTIIPFRPYDGTLLKDHPPCPVDTYIELSRFNANSLLKENLSPSLQSGCTKCQGCSIDDPSDNLVEHSIVSGFK